jgi:hypothetical protein
MLGEIISKCLQGGLEEHDGAIRVLACAATQHLG